ncbi:MAG: elongation factor 4 [SAR324 cluster bacterium]|nr:elongation factor 4 [SAR324 cluster bacterium]
MITELIRNFCIIAHIDHGKSTLADRLLEMTGAISSREKKAQFLDNLDIERERGITVKAQTVSLKYKAKNGTTYLLNLIDTPGHVDFTYEVSQSIKACEGALLIVDAAQGVQAQTVANVYLAVADDLEILPVINKIDLPAAEPKRVLAEIENLIGLDTSEAVEVSAKSGLGVDKLLEEIIKTVPPPKGDPEKPLLALIFDSWFDAYLGVVVLFRVFDGEVSVNDRIILMSNEKQYIVTSLGKHTPHKKNFDKIGVGETGFFTASIKDLSDVRVGDSVTLVKNPTPKALPGYAPIKSMVFSGLYPVDTDDYNSLKSAMAKLSLNDASINYEAESSTALGFGFRCGFLGLLHLEIVQERLEKEFDLNIILTNPSVVFKVIDHKSREIEVDNPVKLPPPQNIKQIKEPYVCGTILTPSKYIGGVMKLAIDKRAIQKSLEYLSTDRAILKFEFPLSEILIDFYDQLKTLTEGYASFDYELIDYRAGKMVRLDILINGELIDALSLIAHKDKIRENGLFFTKQLKSVIPRQMFEVSIQAALGAKIIARETISALRKNVTAKCYGGDITRKRKLLEKQKRGKKRMKQLGTVEVPKEAFLSLLRFTKS